MLASGGRDASAARREPGGRPKKMLCAVSCPPSSARSAEGRSSTSVSMPALDQPGRRLPRKIGRGRGSRGRRDAVASRSRSARRAPTATRADMSLEGASSAAAVTRRSPGAGAGSLSSADSDSRDGRDRHEPGKADAPRNALAHRDPLVSHVADAFRVRAVAVRRERQDLAVAAAARARVAHEGPARSGRDSRARRVEAGRLRSREIQRYRDRDAAADSRPGKPPALGLESHDGHCVALGSELNYSHPMEPDRPPRV